MVAFCNTCCEQAIASHFRGQQEKKHGEKKKCTMFSNLFFPKKKELPFSEKHIMIVQFRVIVLLLLLTTRYALGVRLRRETVPWETYSHTKIPKFLISSKVKKKFEEYRSYMIHRCNYMKKMEKVKNLQFLNIDVQVTADLSSGGGQGKVWKGIAFGTYLVSYWKGRVSLIYISLHNLVIST